MAFDTVTRNKLARMVADARRLLKDEYTEQLQEMYGIQPNGHLEELAKLTHLDDEQKDVAALLRERIEHLASGMETEKEPVAAAIDRMIREQAFTTLNRFAALRMCEERGIVQECVRGALQSKGFLVYLKTAGSGLGEHYNRYRTYLYCVFDEIAVDLGLLFDRYSSLGLLFPREPALVEVLSIINDEELKHIWGEDETVGWIYQYFNTQKERRAMRDASSAPRNSYELAVRNQFFTPRYVVQFLTDNTLGRIWYEMRKGQTSLTEKCQYLVRRPNEIFLKEGEEAPVYAYGEKENLSQEELLEQPVYIPSRSKKDPRKIKILDPACGSGHFLLYSFDLLETIYLEAWEDPELGSNLKKDFLSLEDFRKAVPVLILRYNLHGIDIDARCVQIGSLSLWLRAQKAFKEMGIQPIERPKITKTNIVTAEPMPGEKNLLKEFATKLNTPALGQLVEIVFDKMQLAGEAGSLLMIEEEIRSAVSEAKKLWLQGPKQEQLKLFGDRSSQTQLKLDFSGISDEQFWDQAEEKIYAALQAYAEQTENGSDYQRRMFADDAASGFAFIDLCHQHYDVVLMNPPFGRECSHLQNYFQTIYQYLNNDLYSMFIKRGLDLLDKDGLEGSITSRTFMHLPTFRSLRDIFISPSSYYQLLLISEMGIGVLDGATVRASLNVIGRTIQKERLVIAFGLRGSKDYEKDLLNQVSSFRLSGNLGNKCWLRSIGFFNELPGKIISYWIPESIAKLFNNLNSLGEESIDLRGRPIGNVRVGLTTGDDFRFVRIWYEADSSSIKNKTWKRFLKGGEFRPLENPSQLLISYNDEGKELRFYKGSYFRNEHSFNKHGIACPYISDKGIGAQPCPPDHIIGHASRFIELKKSNIDNILSILGLLCTETYNRFLSCLTADRKHESGILASLPVPSLTEKDVEKLSFDTRSALNISYVFQSKDETTPLFLTLTKDMSGGIASLVNDEHFRIEKDSKKLNIIVSGINTYFWSIYGIDDSEIKAFSSLADYFRATETGKENKFQLVNINRNTNATFASNIISYLFGCLFGRWDIRYALHEVKQPELGDPFEPLPTCPPGMLVGPDGLPAQLVNGKPNIASKGWLEAKKNCCDVPEMEPEKSWTYICGEEYRLKIPWNGIIVDDDGHAWDIIACVRKAIEVIWDEKASDLEQEACQILDVRILRDYFSNSNKFFADHLKRYSKSRRQAPIYWPLSSANGSYTLWIYYHRLTDQTLFMCVTDFIEPKIKEVSRDIDRLKKQLSEGGTLKQQNDLEKLQDFRQELTDFRDELLHITKLPYKPNLNDGVMITACPLWKLFRHNKWSRDLKACWDKLEGGEYDWAHLAYSIWPERVKVKCMTDRSIAIAHNLEELCEIKPPKKKKKTKKRKTQEETEALYDN